MEFGKLATRPKLTLRHIRVRIKWTRGYCFVSTRLWRKTVFTDENRFCFDGPDGQACFRADNSLSKGNFSKLARVGGGLMACTGISWRGKTTLVVVNGYLTQKSMSTCWKHNFCRSVMNFFQTELHYYKTIHRRTLRSIQGTCLLATESRTCHVRLSYPT